MFQDPRDALQDRPREKKTKKKQMNCSIRYGLFNHSEPKSIPTKPIHFLCEPGYGFHPTTISWHVGTRCFRSFFKIQHRTASRWHRQLFWDTMTSLKKLPPNFTEGPEPKYMWTWLARNWTIGATSAHVISSQTRSGKKLSRFEVLARGGPWKITEHMCRYASWW